MATEDGTSAMFGTTTSGIPISHLDYKYVEKCTNGAELEKILKVLRSGEEGTYPDLIEFTEKKLAAIHPQSKALRKEIPIQSYTDMGTSEREQVSGDFENWFSEISQKDSLLKKNSEDDPSNNDFLPPIRSARTVGSSTSGSAQVSNGSGRENKKGTAVPRGYQDWDKFNPDEELKTMEEKEEKELENKREKARINSKDAEISDTIKTIGKTEEELKCLAEHEKNKGNEAFQSGDYKESLVYYSRSIQFKPSAAAHNNKAFAELKLDKYDDAIQDCNVVISLEPNNLKAFLRRAIAYKSKGDFASARQDLKRVLEIEPNNKRGKELLGELNEQRGHPVNSHLNGDINPKKSGKRMKIIEIENENEDEELNDDKEVEKDTDNKPSASLVTDSNHSIIDDTTSKNTNFESSTSNVTNENETNDKEEETDKQETEEQATITGIRSEEVPNVESEVNIAESKDIEEIIDSESQPAPEPVVELPGVVVKAKDEGTSLFKLGRYAEAAEKFTAAVEILEKDKIQFKSALASLLYNRAACFNKMGDAFGCIKDCNASLELIPGTVKPLVKRAASQEMLERFKLSYLDYEAAIFVDSTNKQAQQGKSRVAKHLINMHGSGWREKLQDIKPNTTPVSTELLNTEKTTNQAPSTLNLANVSVDNSQKKPAEDSSTKSREEKPTPPPRISKAEKFEQSKEKGNACVKQGKLDQAISCYSDCIQLDPDKVVSYTNRALCYLRLNKYEQAVEDTSKALDLQPDNVKALYRRALAKKGLREYHSAAKDLLNLSQIDPANMAGKKELEAMLNLCREERREKQKSTDTNNEAKQSNTPKAETTNQKEHPKQTARRRRVQIEEVNDEGDSDDKANDKASSSSFKTSQDSCPSKSRMTNSTIEEPTNKPPTDKNTINKPTTKPTTTTNKPENSNKSKSAKKKKIKLNKATPFDFFQAWNSVKQEDYGSYADILRQIQPVLLPKVLSNKLDGDMLRNIVRAVSEHILPKGEEKFSFEILQHVCKVQRFDMVLLFQDNEVIRELFSKLDSARAKKEFVDVDAFNDVLSKYKVKA